MKIFLMMQIALAASLSNAVELSYPVVDTGQVRCYNSTTEVTYPRPGSAFYGQDAHYHGRQPSYKDNGDGTITDLVTGLMWTQDPGSKKTFDQANAGTRLCKVGGHADWHLPSIKELYSLILFSGSDPDPMSGDTSDLRPYIDTDYFTFRYGNPNDGDRVIDSQFATSTKYRSTTMHGNETMFGVNFADGRIKGYPVGTKSRMPGRGEKTYYALYVRGNRSYGQNSFLDRGDGTVTDKATGLMWMKIDSAALKAGKNGAMNWRQALTFAENLDYAGYSDWRLPNAKELHSIVDYARCPDVTDSAAIDPIFDVTAIRNEGNKKDYPYYWTSTTHASPSRASAGVYIAFGRGLGFMQDRRSGSKTLMDVHGAGAQRSDLKSGSPSRIPQGRGPQGDVMRIYNYVRCVRGGVAEPRAAGPDIEMKRSLRAPSRRAMQGPGRGNPAGGKPGQRPSRADFVRRLDRDNDGKVSQQEFDGPARHFRQLDRNNDGYLSQSEAPQGPPPRQNNRRGPRRK